ncbi:PEGA domain-containing protein [Engelhardtia mirabilis]|uniref:PEGA domain-containing protein n=1 Tax=Engelhardtia mirabilis TaxID=2528011 RepID=UPI003AF39AA9
MQRLRPLQLACAVAGLALLAGCRVQRTLTITSEPPGAEVRIDDELVGNTPMVLPFVHYGTRRFTFYLDGYLTLSTVEKIEPPWYGRFPIDLFTEVLPPLGIDDDHPIHARLVSGEESRTLPALRSVLERAEILRRAGPAGPRRLPPPDPQDEPPPGSESSPVGGVGR